MVGIAKYWRHSDTNLCLVLHVGPHKTGTTSLQKALLSAYGAETPKKFWYPRPAQGPGHADLAWAEFGSDESAEARPMRSLIEAARRSGCERLILSSEAFTLFYPERIAELSQQTAGTDVHLVITLSPIGRRALSAWQARVRSKQLTACLDEARDFILRLPTLAPDFTRRFAENFPGARVSVIITDSYQPENLYEFFSKAAQIELHAPTSPTELVANRGLGLIEAETLRGLNIGLRSLSEEKQRKVQKLLRAFFKSEAWRSTVPYVRLALPQEWIEPLLERCDATIRELRSLELNQRIEILGSLPSLNDIRPGSALDIAADGAEAPANEREALRSLTLSSTGG